MQPLQHAHLRCPPRRIRRRAPQNVIKRSTLGSCADPSKISVGKSSTSFRESGMENSMPCQIGHAICRPCFGLLRNHKHSIWYPSVRNVFIPSWCTVFHHICFPLLGLRSAPWVGIKMFAQTFNRFDPKILYPIGVEHGFGRSPDCCRTRPLLSRDRIARQSQGEETNRAC